MASKVVLFILAGCLSLCTFADDFDELNYLSQKTHKDEAIKYCTSLIERNTGKVEYVRLSVFLAELYLSIGDYSKANKIYYFLEEEALIRIGAGEGPVYKSWLDALDYIGYYQIYSGNYRKAKRFFEQSRQLRMDAFRKNEPGRYHASLGLGILSYYEGNLDVSVEELKRFILSVKNSRSNSIVEEVEFYAKAHFYLAKTLQQKGDYDSAIKIAQENNLIQRHRWLKKRVGSNYYNVVLSECLISDLYRDQKEYKKALKYVNASVYRYKTQIGIRSEKITPLLITRAKVYHLMGELDLAQKDFEEGLVYQLAYIKESFNSLTEYEKENVFKDVRANLNAYNSFGITYIDTFGKEKSQFLINNMLNWQIATKAIILNQANKINKLVQNSTDINLKKSYYDWIRLKNEYSHLYASAKKGRDEEMIDLMNKINVTEKHLLSFFPNLRVDFSKWQDIQFFLRDKVAVEIVHVKREDTEDAYLYFGISDFGAPKIQVAKNGEAFLKALHFYRNCVSLNLEDDNSYSIFWQPITEVLGEEKNVIISPDGVYNLINLETILTPESGYLGDLFSISNVTSLRDVGERHDPLESFDGVLIGHPQYYLGMDNTELMKGEKRSLLRGNISDLPGTEIEVQEIERILTSGNFNEKVLLGKDASEYRVKQTSMGTVVHFATHGFFDESGDVLNPMLNSGLLLSGAGDTVLVNGEDGILTAYEASLLNLRSTKLVVLSACETGLGSILDGEGVYGLQRAFKVADVDFILMTMWKIDDNATQLLIKSFYENLVKTMDVKTAMLMAQNALRDQYPKPAHWGAFKLIGI